MFDENDPFRVLQQAAVKIERGANGQLPRDVRVALVAALEAISEWQRSIPRELD
jgi:hypothetical protein